MPVFLGRRSVVALLTALILLIGVIAATAWLQYQQRSDQVWVDRTYEIQLRLARIWSLTQTAETAGRGYVVTGDETYLQSLLAVTMSNNPQQAQSWSQLREAIEARISNIDSMVQLEASGNHADAVALLRSGKGERLMAQVQAAIQSIADREQKILQERKHASHKSALFTQAGVISALILAMTLGCIVIHDARQQFRSLSTAHQALVESNNRLNQEAEQRLQLQTRRSAPPCAENGCNWAIDGRDCP